MEKSFTTPKVLTETKPVHWAVILAFAIIHMAFTVMVWRYLRYWPPLKHLAALTGGLVQPTLLYYFIFMFLIVGLVILYMGRLKLSDVGVIPSHLKTAALITFFMWLTVHVVSMIFKFLFHASLSPGSDWSKFGILTVMGGLVAQLFGNALYEEIAFRGFLLKQLYLKFEDRSKQKRSRVIWAVLVSQLFFALIHIPAYMVFDANLLTSVSWAALGGVFLAIVYLRTGNLFIAVGIHSLMNKPTLVVQSPFPPQMVLVPLIILLIVLWPQNK